MLVGNLEPSHRTEKGSFSGRGGGELTGVVIVETRGLASATFVYTQSPPTASL
jgi:hypothetical protein